MNIEGSLERLLPALVGTWEGEVSTWFEPHKLAYAAPIRGEIRALAEPTLLVYSYTSDMEGNPFEGHAMIVYNGQANRFEMAWIDTFHQSGNIMLLTGNRQHDRISVLGSYTVPTHGEWGWRTEFRMTEDDRLVVTSYNITPEGEESKGVEAVYTRAV